MTEIIGIKPENGNFPHGFSFKRGDVKLSVSSGRTCINPVAKITPAANALMTKKAFVSAPKARYIFPSNRRQTPVPPAKRINTIASI